MDYYQKEYMLDHLIRENGWESFLSCDSAATSLEEIGNPIHYGARRCLLRHGIPIGDHRARRITKDDYGRYDWIIGMDEENMYYMMNKFGGDPAGKIHNLMDYAGMPGKEDGPIERRGNPHFDQPGYHGAS